MICPAQNIKFAHKNIYCTGACLRIGDSVASIPTASTITAYNRKYRSPQQNRAGFEASILNAAQEKAVETSLAIAR
jgi:hypothetical protein